MIKISDMVIYVLNVVDADEINDRRKLQHIRTEVAAGEEYPAVVMKVRPDQLINLQVFLNENDGLYWRPRAKFSGKGEPGTWHLP